MIINDSPLSRKLSWILLLLVITACSGKTPENLEQHIDQLINNDQYENALEVLEEVDSMTVDANLVLLKEKVHLNYGLYLEYRGPEESSMRDRMTSALEQYIEVLKINPDNEKARAEIQQIMGVYSTIPDRSPGDKIVNELNKLGFDY